MPDDDIAWPRKTRELMNHHMDSTVWNDFVFRDDDVVIVTYAKSGTTWTQQIVAQLIFQGSEETAVHAISPWVDLRVPPAAEKPAMLEAQTHRRIVHQLRTFGQRVASGRECTLPHARPLYHPI